MTSSRLRKLKSERLSLSPLLIDSLSNNEQRLRDSEKLTFPLFYCVHFSPAAMRTITGFLGPVIGPLISGFINQASRVSARRIDSMSYYSYVLRVSGWT